MQPIYSRTVPPCNYIRSSDFSLSDLSIFVDSMEDIARIKRERLERRARRRNNRNLNMKTTVEVHTVPNTITAQDSSEEEHHMQKALSPKELMRLTYFCKKSPVALSSDENYFSGASESSEGKNDQKKCEEIDGITNLSPDSGTESESGNFKLRPRSYAMTNPKYRSTRARIIGLVLKREYANVGNQVDLEQQERRRERVLEGLMRDKKNKIKNEFQCESFHVTKEPISEPLPCKTAKKPSAEMRFIDKALRYLTL